MEGGGELKNFLCRKSEMRQVKTESSENGHGEVEPEPRETDPNE